MRLPFLQYLRPVGDFYIALLQICVLPFLLATIPLAVRSAMASGSAPGVLRSLLFWVLMTLVAVAAVSTIIPSLFFGYSSPNEQMITNIGALLGRSADSDRCRIRHRRAPRRGNQRRRGFRHFRPHPDQHIRLVVVE